MPYAWLSAGFRSIVLDACAAASSNAWREYKTYARCLEASLNLGAMSKDFRSACSARIKYLTSPFSRAFWM